MRKNATLWVLAGVLSIMLLIALGGVWVFYTNGRSERSIESGDDAFWISQFSGAEAAYTLALERAVNSEQSLSAFTRLCRLYEYSGELDRALESCQAALQIEPANADSEARLGSVFSKMGNFDEAVKHGHRALHFDGTNMRGVALLAVFLAQQSAINNSDDYSQAEKLIELALSAAKSDAEVYQSAGSVMRLQGDLEAASNYFQDAVNLAPDFAPYLLDLGGIKKEQGLVIEALEAYGRALDLNPELVQGYQGRGWVLWSTGNFAWAEIDFQKAILLDVKNAESWAGLGWSQLSSGSKDEAQRAFQLALSLDPENENAQTGDVLLNTQLIAADLTHNNIDIKAENSNQGQLESAIDQAIPAAIQIYAFNEKLEVGNTCSGVIVTADGMLLTSAHCMIDADSGQPFNSQGLAGIGFVRDTKIHPERLFQAKAIEIDYSKDVAVLQIMADWDGNHIQSTPDFPYITIGDSDTLFPGDEVWAIGFPGMGGDTMTVTQGVVSGFVERDGLMWIKTDLMTGSGSSGGMVVNNIGELVGIHVQSWSDQNTSNSRLSVECPINAVKPLIEEAAQ